MPLTGGLAGGHADDIHVMWSKTIDPKSPDFGFRHDSDRTLPKKLSGQGLGTARPACRIKTRSSASSGSGVTQREPKTSLGMALLLGSRWMESP